MEHEFTALESHLKCISRISDGLICMSILAGVVIYM